MFCLRLEKEGIEVKRPPPPIRRQSWQSSRSDSKWKKAIHATMLQRRQTTGNLHTTLLQRRQTTGNLLIEENYFSDQHTHINTPYRNNPMKVTWLGPVAIATHLLPW